MINKVFYQHTDTIESKINDQIHKNNFKFYHKINNNNLKF